MHRSLLILLFVFIILAGCTKPTESPERMITDSKGNDNTRVEQLESINNDIDSVTTEEVSQEGKSDGEIKAKKDAQQFLQIIKEKDEFIPEI